MCSTNTSPLGCNSRATLDLAHTVASMLSQSAAASTATSIAGIISRACRKHTGLTLCRLLFIVPVPDSPACVRDCGCGSADAGELLCLFGLSRSRFCSPLRHVETAEGRCVHHRRGEIFLLRIPISAGLPVAWPTSYCSSWPVRQFHTVAGSNVNRVGANRGASGAFSGKTGASIDALISAGKAEDVSNQPSST